MAFTDEDTGGGAAESVGGAGDEDTGHGRILPPKCARTDRRGPPMAPGAEVRGARSRDPPGRSDDGNNVWAAAQQYLAAVVAYALPPVIKKYPGGLTAAHVYTAST